MTNLCGPMQIASVFFYIQIHMHNPFFLHQHYAKISIHAKEDSAVRTIWIAGVLVVLVAAGLSGYKVVWKEKNVAAVQEEQMAAPATKNQTGKAKASFHPSRVSDNDLKIMANAVYGESRGEPFEGQVAVAAVILNRVKSPSFPDTPSAVIFEPRAFTAVADGQIWLTPNESATKAVKNALNGWDPTGGCTYYFNPDTATSGWIWTRPQVKKIGKHIFCR
ncbi:cell wall hydrolase [Brevibacillus formosus]|uniref:cell wall hydrolase n=1 Tax=Brevibacillus TaxID=55080 RepID=UPI000D106F65|nr:MULTISPECIES: cell wall hydrolase [Brevibacillus]MBG9946122.1 spore cortex-lytic protein [Brevibacillus formosus]MED1944398.1 cell wall hydrolase [Brevibacillus formosus]MED1999230.1 cell wall hydrolase [Brevibacillus formosus]MED2082633.1 cell wall hydrolase [Brevibacillus formosus]PSK04650.1 spore cortex-lytic protein [Brevibacillus sp. NRRL NRS-603]